MTDEAMQGIETVGRYRIQPSEYNLISFKYKPLNQLHQSRANHILKNHKSKFNLKNLFFWGNLI